jgi:hypothetical protein
MSGSRPSELAFSDQTPTLAEFVPGEVPASLAFFLVVIVKLIFSTSDRGGPNRRNPTDTSA